MMTQLTRRLDVAGGDIARLLIKLLLMRGHSFNRTADFESVREIKKKVCIPRSMYAYAVQALTIPFSSDLELDQKLTEEITTSSKVIQ